MRLYTLFIFDSIRKIFFLICVQYLYLSFSWSPFCIVPIFGIRNKFFPIEIHFHGTCFQFTIRGLTSLC